MAIRPFTQKKFTLCVAIFCGLTSLFHLFVTHSMAWMGITAFFAATNFWIWLKASEE